MLFNPLTRPVPAVRETYRSIDLLRGLAALAILVFHANHFTMGGGALSRSPSFVDGLALVRLLEPVREHGALAVMLFWTISGFVFMNVYAGTRPGGWTFFVNRFSRLYPLHFVTLLVVAGLQAIAVPALGHPLIYGINDAYHFMLQLFFASEWGLQQGRSFNGPIWSISVEVLIYFVFYLYARFLPVNLLTVMLGLLGFAGLYRLLPGNLIVLCGIFFFGGMLSYTALTLVPARARGVAGWLALTGAAALFALLAVLGPGRLPLTMWLLPIFALLLLALAISEHSVLSGVYRRARALGDVTYSSYLWHSPLQMMFLLGAGLGWWPLDVAFTSLFIAAYLLGVPLFGYASFAWLERPAQRWLRKVLLRSPAPARPPVGPSTATRAGEGGAA